MLINSNYLFNRGNEKNYWMIPMNFVKYPFKNKFSGWDKDVDRLINFFERDCFFKGKFGKDKDHNTFIRKNGLKYYETHHFIQRKAKKGIESIVDASANILQLCSCCHSRIHYGTTEDIREMLRIVLKNEEIKKLLEDKCVQKMIGNDSIEKWIQKMYDVDLTDKG